MIGVRSREPIRKLLRSRAFFDWFDAIQHDIPAVFAGEIVDRFVAATSPPTAPALWWPRRVGGTSNLTAEVRSAIAGIIVRAPKDLGSTMRTRRPAGVCR